MRPGPLPIPLHISNRAEERKKVEVLFAHLKRIHRDRDDALPKNRRSNGVRNEFFERIGQSQPFDVSTEIDDKCHNVQVCESCCVVGDAADS
ncbi:hypothetical protein LMG28138_05258 [Pararobbsia alpina]|uniref:Uncharacterized protein n=1 Tax=Pararobbsia alpina TaxID=621374 RepID=A0A6S7C7D1_9BURK|nr:hypothetical protein LMG28138_05258 [Pararobbsia alpina]